MDFSRDTTIDSDEEDYQKLLAVDQQHGSSLKEFQDRQEYYVIEEGYREQLSDPLPDESEQGPSLVQQGEPDDLEPTDDTGDGNGAGDEDVEMGGVSGNGQHDGGSRKRRSESPQKQPIGTKKIRKAPGKARNIVSDKTKLEIQIQRTRFDGVAVYYVDANGGFSLISTNPPLEARLKAVWEAELFTEKKGTKISNIMDKFAKLLASENTDYCAFCRVKVARPCKFSDNNVPGNKACEYCVKQHKPCIRFSGDQKRLTLFPFKDSEDLVNFSGSGTYDYF